MIIKEIEIYRYNIPLLKPLPVKHNFISSKEGLILLLKDNNGHVGIGEIAPLPGLSRELLTDVITQTRNLLPNFVGQSFGVKSKGISWLTHGFVADFKFYPSVRFGIEMALLSLHSNVQQRSLAALLDDQHVNNIPINGLLFGDKDEMVVQAKRLIDEGYQCLKLKVGAGKIEDDITKAQAVSNLLNGKAVLRIDANKAWSLKEALRFAEEVGIINIEYIEEPLKNLDEIPAFYQESLIPVALDESFTANNLEQVKSLDGVEFIIIKPMLLGGLARAYELSQNAKAFGLSVIISSAFESRLGLTALAHLASAVNHFSAAGIDTDRWFTQQIWRPEFKKISGRWTIGPDDFLTKWLDVSLLEKIQ